MSGISLSKIKYQEGTSNQIIVKIKIPIIYLRKSLQGQKFLEFCNEIMHLRLCMTKENTDWEK